MTAPALRPETAWRQWALPLLLMAANTLSFVDRQILSLLIEPIRRDLGLGDGTAGMLYGLGFTLTYLLAAFPLAWLADRIGPRRVIVGAVMAWSLATGACGLARSLGGLIAARMAVGLGEGGLTPAAMAWISRQFPRERTATAIGVFQTGIYLGNGLALLVGAWIALRFDPAGRHMVPLLGPMAGWQVAFLLLVLPGLALAVALALCPAPRGGESERATAPSVAMRGAAGWRIGALPALLIVAYACLVLGGNGAQVWTPTLLQRQFGWSVQQSGFVLGTLSLGFGILGTLGGGLAADAMARRSGLRGPIALAQGAMLVVAPIALAFPLAPDAGVAVALIGAHQMASAFALCGGMAALQGAAPDAQRTRITAMLMVAINLGGTLAGPWIMGVVSDAWPGAGLGPAMAVTGCLATLLAALLMARAQRLA
ncbi:MFS transporter [Sphingomonas sp. R3G8C]|uniref:MFS transporter n=1 Tax=Novosphingobium rhizosphaerae TaxID=1551649 RepID=UPI0015CE3813